MAASFGRFSCLAMDHALNLPISGFVRFYAQPYQIDLLSVDSFPPFVRDEKKKSLQAADAGQHDWRVAKRKWVSFYNANSLHYSLIGVTNALTTWPDIQRQTIDSLHTRIKCCSQKFFTSIRAPDGGNAPQLQVDQFDTCCSQSLTNDSLTGRSWLAKWPISFVERGHSWR